MAISSQSNSRNESFELMINDVFLAEEEIRLNTLIKGESESNRNSDISFGDMTHTPIQLTWTDVKVTLKQKSGLCTKESRDPPKVILGNL